MHLIVAMYRVYLTIAVFLWGCAKVECYVLINGILKCAEEQLNSVFYVEELGKSFTKADNDLHFGKPAEFDYSSICTTSVIDMSFLFSNKATFNQNISHWDTSNVNDMSGLFFEANVFNQSISNWDVSNVENMLQMFYGAKAFNQDISKWNTSRVENMYQMFMLSKFNSDISGWDTSRVTDMKDMFFEAESFNRDLSSWCVPLIPVPGPMNFALRSPLALSISFLPQWGTCPTATSTTTEIPGRRDTTGTTSVVSGKGSTTTTSTTTDSEIVETTGTTVGAVETTGTTNVDSEKSSTTSPEIVETTGTTVGDAPSSDENNLIPILVGSGIAGILLTSYVIYKWKWPKRTNYILTAL